MLCVRGMSLAPFIVLCVLNGLVVGCAAGLVARALGAEDPATMRFRDASTLAMIGALMGSIVASLIESPSMEPDPVDG